MISVRDFKVLTVGTNELMFHWYFKEPKHLFRSIYFRMSKMFNFYVLHRCCVNSLVAFQKGWPTVFVTSLGKSIPILPAWSPPATCLYRYCSAKVSSARRTFCLAL